MGLQSEDYTSNHIIKQSSNLYSGYTTLLVDEQVIDRFYNKENIIITNIDAKKQKTHLYPNQFIMLISNTNEKKTALVRYIDDNTPLRKIKNFDSFFGDISPKNKEQSFALDILTDPDISIVSLVGNAGTGKTLIAIAAGLQQIIPNNKTKSLYSRLIVSRPVQPLGKDIGFLP